MIVVARVAGRVTLVITAARVVGDNRVVDAAVVADSVTNVGGIVVICCCSCSCSCSSSSY